MEDNKYRKFYVEWWHIRKSTIYGAITVLVLGALIGGGAWWASRNNWFLADETTDIPKDAARITSFEGEVRIVRAQTRETILVTKPTFVSAGDTIQTQSDGRVIVQMIDGSVFKLGPNSATIIRESSSLFGKNVRVSLGEGQLNVRTEDQPEGSRNVVEVAETENVVLPKTDASFNADGTGGGEIRISRGGVETTIGGEQTTIGPDQFASVNGGKLSAREKLLAPPRPTSPGNSDQILDSSGNGVSVSFSWLDAEAGNAANFYLQVARSPYFASDSILVDRGSLQAREFRLNGLSPGTYYWRLKSTARSGQTTNWNDPWKFSVVKNSGNIAIDASEWVVEPLGGTTYIIRGRTQPGMSVRSLGRHIYASSDGSFTLQISTASAEAKIEIGDDRGNRSGFVLSMRSGNLVGRY